MIPFRLSEAFYISYERLPVLGVQRTRNPEWMETREVNRTYPILAVAFLAVACLGAATVLSPRQANALTMEDLKTASRSMSDMTQKILQTGAEARGRIDRANAEMDAQDRVPAAPPEALAATQRIEGHLQAARERLQDAKRQMSRLADRFQRELARSRKGRRTPSPAETEEEKLAMVRFNEAYRESETRAGRSYEQVLLALMQAEERFLALKKKATGGVPPGN